ncbi:MAG: oligosaccharide flippase family protein [Terriglobia bacterium]
MEEAAATAGVAMAGEGPACVTPAAEPRRLAINYLFLSGGEFTAKLLTFASFTYLARVLGPLNYGSVEFTLAAMVFFTLPADLGLASYGAREVARHPDRASRLLHEITGLRVALTLGSMLALGIFILVIHKSNELKILLALYGVSLLAGPFLLQWFFQAHDQMHWVGIASIVRQAGFAGLVFLMCRRGSPLSYIGFIECASVAAMTVFCLYVSRHRMGFAWPWPDLHVIRLMGHIREAAPIGLNELAWAFMWYFCTVLLGFIFPDRSLGWFGASHRAVMALHTFVYLYFFNLLPSISRCAALPHKYLLELMDRSIRLGAWASLFLAALLTALAPQLLTLMYGPPFRPASHSFSILVWMLPVAMLSGHHRYILIAYNHQKTLLRCTAYSAAVAVLLGFALVPFYRGPGAAWALLIALLLNLALVYISVRRLVVEVPVHRQLAAPLTALAVSVILYLVLARWNVGVALAASAAVYMTGLVRSDGRRLASFLLTIVRKPSGSRGCVT